jgi:hypothetical protein
MEKDKLFKFFNFSLFMLYITKVVHSAASALLFVDRWSKITLKMMKIKEG